MEYKIVEGSSASVLQREVNDLIEKGWEVSGGIAVSNSTGYPPYFYQAMIKQEEGYQ